MSELFGWIKTLSIRRAAPTRAATRDEHRPLAEAVDRLQGLRVAGLEVLGLDTGGGELGAGGVETGGEGLGAGPALGGGEGARERRRPLAVGRLQVGIAAAHRQAVGLAHGRDHLYPHREVEVADHAEDDDRLLGGGI